MNRYSYLDGDTLSALCKKQISYLSEENEALFKIDQVYDWRPGAKQFSGESAEAYLGLLRQFRLQFIERQMEDNSILAHKFEKLAQEVYGVKIVGAEVLDKQDEAFRNAQEHGKLAEEYFEKAYKATSTQEYEKYQNLGKQEDRYYNEWNNIYKDWLEKEERYDEIDEWAVHLFNCVGDRPNSIIKKPGGWGFDLKGDPRKVEIDIDDSDAELLRKYGYSEEQIRFILSNYPSLVAQLRGAETSTNPKYVEEVIQDINGIMWDNAIFKPNYDSSQYRGGYCNCMSFAWGITTGPINPGDLSGMAPEDADEYAAFKENLYNDEDALLEVLQKDADALGVNLTPIASDSPGFEGGVVVCLYKYKDGNGKIDFHWCVYNPEENQWQQVNGGTGVVKNGQFIESTSGLGGYVVGGSLGDDPSDCPGAYGGNGPIAYSSGKNKYQFVQKFCITPKFV